jgi:hypothetical protein
MKRFREERPADEAKSWRRGPPDAKLPPVAHGESSVTMHVASKPKEEQRRVGRDRGKATTDSEEKKKGSRRSVAPPPGFASTGEQKVRTAVSEGKECFCSSLIRVVVNPFVLLL